MSRVQLAVIKPWITQRVTELLGIEDEIVIDTITNLLEDKTIVVSTHYLSCALWLIMICVA